MSTHPTTTAARSSLATSGLIAAGISAVALVVLLIGRVAGWNGFQADDNGGPASGVAFAIFVLTFLVTLVIAIVLAVKGRRSEALPLAGYLVVAVVLSLLENAGLFG